MSRMDLIAPLDSLTKWTREGDAALLAARRRKLTVADIAQEIGRSSRAVQARLIKLRKRGVDVAVRGTDWTALDDAEMEAMQATGMSYAEIGAVLGRTAVACQKRMARNRAGSQEWRNFPKPTRAAIIIHASAKPAPSVAVQLVSYAAARIAAVGNSKAWGPARDLVLAETLAAGGTITDAARAIGCRPTDAEARWFALCPVRNVAGIAAAYAAAMRAGVGV